MTPVNPLREKDILQRLGAAGLSRVLEDTLDQGRLIRLANACELRYPGMRPQSQKRSRILEDLVKKAGEEESARRVIFRMLRKELSGPLAEWQGLSIEERNRRVSDASLRADPQRVGVHLYLLAAALPQAGEEVVIEEALTRILSREDLRAAAPSDEAPSPASLGSARDATRLLKKTAELQKKIQYLEGQLARSRETEKVIKRDLLQRKGELAESRMLAERLGRELQEAKEAGTKASAAAPAEAALTEMERLVRRMAGEQKKLLHRVEKLASSPPAPAALPAEALAPLVERIDELGKETAALRRERKRDLQEQARRLEELLAELKAARAAAEASPKAARHAARRRGEPDRVSVFIDVQNMYYAARQLKGKLDFDSLLQAAVRDRRLIKATAYVVESKEIDQSGFIAMLQQRAIEVRRKTLRVRADGSMKGDWDMEMALDILEEAPKLDVVALVSGDGDFTSLVNRVKSIGPRVEVLGFPRNTAKSLLEAADAFHPLDRKFMIRTGDSEPESSRRSTPADEPQEPEPSKPISPPADTRR